MPLIGRTAVWEIGTRLTRAANLRTMQSPVSKLNQAIKLFLLGWSSDQDDLDQKPASEELFCKA